MAEATNKIGNVEINGRAFLAPMAGVTDLAYRRICTNMGAAYSVTEMLSSKAVQYGDKKTKGLAELDDIARPVGLQIFGDEPDTMAFAASELMEFSPDIIDINMGCPVPKIAGNNSGSALMKNPELCGEIVAEIVKKVDVPVTVKIRKGWDEDSVNAVEVAKICEAAGAAAICVHGRTKAQMYTGNADWQIIKDVKSAVKIPVIGNGDVVDANSACRMLDETGCDFIMVGRGALGNPWVFREINAYLTERCTILPPPTISEKIIGIKKHIDLLCEYKGEDKGMREARKHVAWYIHGVRNAAEFRRRSGELCTLSDLDRLLADIYETNKDVGLEERIERSKKRREIKI